VLLPVQPEQRVRSGRHQKGKLPVLIVAKQYSWPSTEEYILVKNTVYSNLVLKIMQIVITVTVLKASETLKSVCYVCLKTSTSDHALSEDATRAVYMNNDCTCIEGMCLLPYDYAVAREKQEKYTYFLGILLPTGSSIQFLENVKWEISVTELWADTYKS
jgi:hypothetical protein